MILEERNLEIYGYISTDLLPKSDKPIVVMCDKCGRERIISKKANTLAKNQDQLCQSCRSLGNKSRTGQKMSKEEIEKHRLASIGNKSRTGQKASKEEIEKHRKAMIGNKHNLGHTLTPEQSERKSASIQHQDYDAGEWTGWADKTQPHLTPIHKCIQLNERFEESNGHHIMESVVIFIPSDLHRNLYHNVKTSKNMKKMNKLAINFLLGKL